MSIWRRPSKVGLVLAKFRIGSAGSHPLSLSSLVQASTNFGNCLQDVRNGLFGPNAGLNNVGQPIAVDKATAIPYNICVQACGGEPEAFNWSVFSSQFSAWLLPWLALLSQLPFGANDKLENFLTVVLTIGSPTLAAYSAALTVLNGRWIARRFSGSIYPNTYYAIRTLSSLQQAPLQLDRDGDLLASLVVLPENDNWWKELLERINCTPHTWSIAAVTSIGWVLIAYLVTVIDSLSNVLEGVAVNGQAVGSIWVWLLPIVIAWLQISPRCDSERIKDALCRANNIAYVATATSAQASRAASLNDHRAVSLRADDSSLHSDERCTSPIYNYARLFSWTAAAEEVAHHFLEATRRARLLQPVAHETAWVHGDRNSAIRDENRSGKSFEVVAYCTSFLHPRRSRWGSCVWSRIVIASIFANLLQWGTAGAAIFVVWQTPTKGLGCRSGSYLIYAVVSTIVWAMLILASILSHYSTFDLKARNYKMKDHHHRRAVVAAVLSVVIRRLGKTIAAVNAMWIVAACMFQFSAFFDRCYCNGLGTAWAYTVIEFLPEDLSWMRSLWLGGVFLSVLSAAIYVGFINMFIDPPLPIAGQA